MMTTTLLALAIAAPVGFDNHVQVNIPKLAKAGNVRAAMPDLDLFLSNTDNEQFYFAELKMGQLNVEAKSGKVAFIHVASEDFRSDWRAALPKVGLSASNVTTEKVASDPKGEMLWLKNIKGIPKGMPVCWVPGSLYVGQKLD